MPHVTYLNASIAGIPRTYVPRHREKVRVICLAVALLGICGCTATLHHSGATTSLASGRSVAAGETNPAGTAQVFDEAWLAAGAPSQIRGSPDSHLWLLARIDSASLARGLVWLGSLDQPAVTHHVARAAAAVQREACLAGLAELAAAGDSSAPEAHWTCAAGGQPTRDLDGAPACTIHGSPEYPRALARQEQVRSLADLAAPLPADGDLWIAGSAPRGSARFAVSISGAGAPGHVEEVAQKLAGGTIDLEQTARRAGLTLGIQPDRVWVRPAPDGHPEPPSLPPPFPNAPMSDERVPGSPDVEIGRDASGLARQSTVAADGSAIAPAAGSTIAPSGVALAAVVDLGEPAAGRKRWPPALVGCVGAQAIVEAERAELTLTQVSEAAAMDLESWIDARVSALTVGGPFSRLLARVVQGKGAEWLVSTVEKLHVTREGQQVRLSVTDVGDPAPLVVVAAAGFVALAEDSHSYDPGVGLCAAARSKVSMEALAWMAREGVPPPADPGAMRERGYARRIEGCPAGGTFTIGVEGSVTCSVHGR